MPQTATGSSRGDWSKPANGLSGRLVIELEALELGVRHAIHAELKNEALESIVLTSQPRCDARLSDAAGTPVPVAGFPSSGPMPAPHWAMVPPEAYIGLRIDTRAAAIPTRERALALVAVGGRSWALGAGVYVLSVALAFEEQNSGPERQWLGTLDLPPVGFEVTAAMFQAPATRPS
ncbi:MAG: hypothetical protein GEV05_21135 [Betaproteobacteria bacterium]|nr:hypothetical protein [Betaproteobacteria bacterium]